MEVPEPSHHFEVGVGRGRRVAQIGGVAAPSRGSIAASPLGRNPDDDRSMTHSYNRAGFLGLPRGTPTERLPWSLFPISLFEGV